MKKNKIAILFLLALTVLIGCNKDKELEPRQPKVTNEEVTTSSNSATISWMVDFPGVIHTGIEIGLAEDLADFRSIEAFKNQANQNAVYSVGIDSLVPMTKYYYRQVVWNSYKRFEFDVKEFTTKAGLPIVETFEVGDITPTSAKGSGKVVSDSGAEIIECGICWATATHPTIQADHIVAVDSHDVFVLEMTDLLPGIRYYVRAYAKNSVGFVYGNEVSFVTGDAVLPSVTTLDVADITWTTAKGGGNVTDDGDAEITERGICWSTSHNPTTNESHVNSGTGTGFFTGNMTGLTANTTYYVRAYAINSAGTNYGSEVSFTTQQAITLPTVTTGQVTNIQQTSATGGGNVTNSGGANVTERGICWGASHNPTTSGSHASNGTGTGSYTVNMSGLSPSTTYYVRAYAINSAGTSYGSEVPFTTLSSVGGHTYVDLGLPSGLLWATCNVGADSPEEYGDYFAWGETQPKSDYSWSTYQYCMGSSTRLTKYCNNSSYGYNGYTDNLTTLQPGDDAATANWGSGWRMPTKEECQELVDNTTFTFTTQNGVYGGLFTATNGNSLFLPRAGQRYGTSLENAGWYGSYWSSSLHTVYPDFAWGLFFEEVCCDTPGRLIGRPVRPVHSASKN